MRGNGRTPLRTQSRGVVSAPVRGPLRAIRQARGLRAVDEASAAGVSMGTVWKIEQGKVAGLSLRMLVQVAWAVGVAPAELVPALAARPAKAQRPTRQ